MIRRLRAPRPLLLLVATANLVTAAYLLAVEHTFGGPGLLVLLGVILLIAASRPPHREP